MTRWPFNLRQIETASIAFHLIFSKHKATIRWITFPTKNQIRVAMSSMTVAKSLSVNSLHNTDFSSFLRTCVYLENTNEKSSIFNKIRWFWIKRQKTRHRRRGKNPGKPTKSMNFHWWSTIIDRSWCIFGVWISMNCCLHLVWSWKKRNPKAAFFTSHFLQSTLLIFSQYLADTVQAEKYRKKRLKIWLSKYEITLFCTYWYGREISKFLIFNGFVHLQQWTKIAEQCLNNICLVHFSPHACCVLFLSFTWVAGKHLHCDMGKCTRRWKQFQKCSRDWRMVNDCVLGDNPCIESLAQYN